MPSLEAVTVPPVTSTLPPGFPLPPPMPAPNASSPRHFAVREPLPSMTTDAPSGTPRPARSLPLTRRLSEPSASVTLAVAPDLISKAQSFSPDSSMPTPSSVTFAALPDADTAMRSVLVVEPGAFMETTMGVPVLSSRTLLPYE
jgi:hypothetical protein